MTCKFEKIPLLNWKNNLSSHDCIIDYSMNLMDIARKESNGECVFCREGTKQIYEIIKDITEGNALRDDMDLLLDILKQIQLGTSCNMTKNVALTCLELIEAYEEEWELHIRRKRCSNLVCNGMYTLYIDPEVCNGCSHCLRSAPKEMIMGEPGMIHVINQNNLDKLSIDLAICPLNAIKKAGPIKPKLPAKPIPVGSFDQKATGNNEGSRRKRRRS